MNDDGGLLVSLLPMFILSIPLAIANYFLAFRLGKNGLLWAILTMIPLINFFAFWYLIYSAAFSALDRVAALERQVGSK